ncbi:MAG: hypothetical protein KDD56_01325 [Bdellovibrionales bacterium]|nr:hypothetical protein [Bdellovibrionales bacterium]
MSKKQTDERELALKSFFLGPQAENAYWVRKLANAAFLSWIKWRKEYSPNDGVVVTATDRENSVFKKRKKKIEESLIEVLERFRDELPSFTPRYIGHMLSEISIPALLGHIVTLLHNPNNITQEVSFVGTQIEREAIVALAQMMGFNTDAARGHFTSGGTVANIEGLVRARARMARWLSAAAFAKANSTLDMNLFEAAHMGWKNYDQLTSGVNDASLKEFNILHTNPFDTAKKYKDLFGVDYRGAVIFAPGSKHYCWPKGAILMGFGSEAFWSIDTDAEGKICIQDLKKKLQKARKENRPIAAIISVAGTTEMGDFDPIDKVQDELRSLKDDEGIRIWHHVDAAYGGFFCTLPRDEKSPVSKEMFSALDAIRFTNSVTVDPHKLGYVPYSSGAFISAVPREYYVTPFEAPYLRFEQRNYIGTQTLEGSRSAGGAVAMWLTAKSIGLDENGYGYILEKTIKQQRKLEKALKAADSRIKVAPNAETNILLFCVALDKEPLSKTNERTNNLYAEFSHKGSSFFVSITTLTWRDYDRYLDSFTSSWTANKDTEGLALIRCTLMHPFFDSKEMDVNFLDEFVKEVCQKIKNISGY